MFGSPCAVILIVITVQTPDKIVWSFALNTFSSPRQNVYCFRSASLVVHTYVS